MRWFYNLGEKRVSVKAAKLTEKKTQSFVLPLEVGFTGLQAAHRGRQQHGAETEQKLEKIHFYHFHTYTL